MKSKILEVLRSTPGVVSGESLCGRLGISRVAVWKHVRKLKELGYRIDANSLGYRHVSSPDVPYPWEFPEREGHIHYFPQLTSTMDTAKQMARDGCDHFTVVVAGRQSMGRGRLKRRWLSDEGGLYFTVVLRPSLPLVMGFRINFLAAVTLVQVLREKHRIEARVKWPNDVLVGDRKLCGMLSEIEAEGDHLTFINIGLGVNLNNHPTRLGRTAVTLRQITGGPVSRKMLLQQFLDEFEHRMQGDGLDRVVSEWKRCSATLNRKVRIVTTRDVFEGLAVDVDDGGALVLKMADGSLRKVVYGDCFFNSGPTGAGDGAG